MRGVHVKRGFTLIELVVVLAVLAVLTHLAVREMAHLRDDRLGQAAARQMEELRDAVWNERGPDGPGGFVADLGRLPRGVVETNGLDAAPSVSLRELWTRPADVPPYALRPATAANLVASDAGLEDAEVMVACGWRGPYVRLPAGAERLADAWGNRMENRDEAGYDRLFREDRAAAAGECVTGVRHLGADGRLDADVTPAGAAQRDAEIRFLPAGGETNVLAVSTDFVDGSGPRTVSGTVRVRWYAPCGGAITGGVADVSADGTARAFCRFESLPPGVATVTVTVGGRKCAQERVRVPPGGRDVSIKVFVP